MQLGRGDTAADSVADRLTSRPRPPALPAESLTVGKSMRTGMGERRRVVLPGGSVLFVDQNSEARLESAGRLQLLTGELFLEAATPQESPLAVVTPERTIRGSRASFGVRLDGKGARVLVTRGEVRVALTGKEVTLQAGQQLAADGDEPTAAPRTSHLLAWTRELRIAAESPLVPRSEHAGGALIARDPGGNEAHLSLRKYHIDVHIEDGFARTTIDQTYFNDGPWQLEGTFYFPLPPDASLSRLAMYVDGKLMEGGMAEREHARQVYETIRYTQRDPALLEWVDGSTFKMRVFPLEARQEKRIILSYTQKLPTLYGQATYRFPAGHSLQKVRDWSFHARVKNAADLSWASPSHTLAAAPEATDLVLDAALKNATFDRDVVLTLAERDPAQFRYSEGEQDGARYLMLRYRPSLTIPPTTVGNKHWVFLAESSGDRDPLLVRLQIELIRGLLQQADPRDTFMVLSAGTRVRSWNAEPQSVNLENIQAAMSFLENAHLVGALDLGQALSAAAAALRKQKNAYLVHVGTGIAAMGERRENVLAGLLPEGARYVGVGIGRRWARSLMKTAAERSRGHFTQVNPDEPIAWRAFDLFATLSAPHLIDLHVKDRTGKATFLVFSQAVAQGEELCAVTRIGRDDPLPENVMIHGIMEGQPVELTVKFQKRTERADYLPRTWAKLEIERLLAEDALKNKERIIALSKAMYVMTPFTSLLVLENEDLYTQYKVDRGRQDHWAMYPCPKKIPVVVEADPNAPGGLKNGPKTAKQVFDTVFIRKLPRFIAVPERSVIPVNDDLVSFTGTGVTGQDDLRVFALMPAPVHARIESQNGRFAPAFVSGITRSSADLPVQGLTSISRGDSAWFLAGTLRALPDAYSPQLTFGIPIRPLATGGVASLDIKQAKNSLPIGDLFMEGIVEAAPPYLFARSGHIPIIGNTITRDRVIRRMIASDGMSHPVENYEVVPAPLPSSLKLSGFLAYDEPTIFRQDNPHRSQIDGGRISYIYQRSGYSDDASLFSDLLAYAPGMNTSEADIAAVIEAEAIPGPHGKRGQIDAGARALFARARMAGWHRITFSGKGEQPPVTILFDGMGRNAFDRVLSTGLKEHVVCDGKQLLHLYPELAVGARRAVSRFHRGEFWHAVPWAVPPVEDLARGADLKCLDPRTVAVVPHLETQLLEYLSKHKKKDGSPAVTWLRLHLVFGGDGRLAERQLVRMPKQEILSRECIDADGTIRLLDGKGKELSVRKATLRDAAAPDLAPDTKNLIVLALPYRTRDHVKQVLKLEKTANAGLRLKDALPLLASEMAVGNTKEAVALFKEVFHAREQRQLGLYVLLAACGANLDGQDVDVLAEHVDEPVAQYLALHSSPVLRKHASQWAAGSGQWGQGLLKHLGVSHALYQRWQDDRVLKVSAARREAERQRALDYVRRNKGGIFGWVLLTLLEDRAGEDKEFNRTLADAWPLFENVPGLAYAARYEQARCLLKSGQVAAAQKKFLALYEATLKDGVLPTIDKAFRQALLEPASRERQRPDDRADTWNELLRKTAARLIAEKHRAAVLALAWQCWQLEDQPLANHLLATALEGIGDAKERTAMQLAGIAFLSETGQLVQAGQHLRLLLNDPKLGKDASLWRFGAHLAQRRELTDRALECLEQALELEYRKPPAVIDLQKVREDYAKLLAHYQHLADAMVTLKIQPPPGFLARAVRAADRWRALDPDGSVACQAAAGIVLKLGEQDLCWDYLTTPIGLKPNEADPWLNLAVALSRKGDLDLADRAYAVAYAAEPTNAQILWDRAQNLRQSGKHLEAGQLFRQIAEGRWQPRFQGVQTQARLQLP
jgi:tetratricopeptide (TPR) repeat protein